VARRIIDISVPLENDVSADPPIFAPQIEYVDHVQTAEQLCSQFPGLSVDDLPDRQGYAIERIKLTTHNGTHVDAPWHYHPTMDNGVRAITIDEVPLDWCMQPGVKLDFRHMSDGHVITAAEVETELRRIGHTLKPLEIIVINTSAGRAYGDSDYVNRGCGMGRESTLYLTDRGIRVVGTDGWSWDAPFKFSAERYRQTRDASIVVEAHKAGREACYCQIEKLHNLEQLPPTGFSIVCFPVKIRGASGGWTRAVAILDD
jgi:kynurenine formamidase